MENITIWKRFGTISLCRQSEVSSITETEFELLVIVKKTGINDIGFNMDLNRKIQQLLSDKRKQHKTKYEDYLKCYYFLIDCPVSRLREIDEKRVLKNIKNKEVVVICGVSVVEGKLVENKKVITASDLSKYSFDFSNNYFELFSL